MQETLRGMIHSNGAPSPTCASFLKRVVEAPLPQAVDYAVTLLIDIGAFTSAEEDERITRLGRHLADLPLHLRVGKMLLYASLLGVLDPILTIACAGAYKPPFIIGTDSGRQNAPRKVFPMHLVEDPITWPSFERSKEDISEQAGWRLSLRLRHLRLHHLYL